MDLPVCSFSRIKPRVVIYINTYGARDRAVSAMTAITDLAS